MSRLAVALLDWRRPFSCNPCTTRAPTGFAGAHGACVYATTQKLPWQAEQGGLPLRTPHLDPLTYSLLLGVNDMPTTAGERAHMAQRCPCKMRCCSAQAASLCVRLTPWRPSRSLAGPPRWPCRCRRTRSAHPHHGAKAVHYIVGIPVMVVGVWAPECSARLRDHFQSHRPVYMSRSCLQAQALLGLDVRGGWEWAGSGCEGGLRWKLTWVCTMADGVRAACCANGIRALQGHCKKGVVCGGRTLQC